MPGGDRTGPMGMGPMTGRGAGYCAGFNTPGFVNPVPRMGMAFRRGAGFYGRSAGFGRGAGRGFARGSGNFGQPAQTFRTPQQPGGQRIQPAQNPQPATIQPAQPQQAPPQATNPPNPQPQIPAQPSKEQEIRMLENQLVAFEDQIGQIKNRIDQLRGQSR